MDLNIMHLSAYLPYRMEVLLAGTKKLAMVPTAGGKDEVNIATILTLPSYQPLLLPIDEMPPELICEIGYTPAQLKLETKCKGLSYSVWEYLVARHVDVFGLIEAGLAVSKTKYYEAIAG